MITKRNISKVIGTMLLIAGFTGIFFASPDFVQIIQLEDGSATMVPRIPWAAGCAELSVIFGFGFLIVPSLFKGK